MGIGASESTKGWEEKGVACRKLERGELQSVLVGMGSMGGQEGVQVEVGCTCLGPGYVLSQSGSGLLIDCGDRRGFVYTFS